MLAAVIMYDWYFGELKQLKVATKKHQTLSLLNQKFPNLELWTVLDQDDEKDIVAGSFNPGHFALGLVRRHYGLRGQDDRTLKNYRRALRAANLMS